MDSVIQKCNFNIGNVKIELILQVGFSMRGAQSAPEMHRHPNFEVHYISKGDFKLETSSYKKTVNQGTLILIPPKIYHSFTGISEGYERMSFEIRFIKRKNGAKLYENYKSLFERVTTPFIYNNAPRELDIAAEHMGIVKSEEDISGLRAVLNLVFIKICELLRERSDDIIEIPSASAQADPTDTDVAFILASRYIKHNASRHITLSDIAKEVNLSERQVQRMLTIHLGEGFRVILSKTRIEDAKELLSNHPTISLEETAIKCGFSNYVSFWKQFKNIVGITPDEYKKQIKSRS